MTVSQLSYRPRGGQVAPGGPPARDLTRADIVALSGAGFSVAAGPPGHRTYLSGAGQPATNDAPVDSAAWLTKIDAFVAACVASGSYTVVETDDPPDDQGGI